MPTGYSKAWLLGRQYQLYPFDFSLTMVWSFKKSDSSSEVNLPYKWNRIDEGLKSLDNPAVCACNPVEGPMWMRNWSGEWFRYEPLRRMIARTLLKTLTNRTNDWPINQTNQPIKLSIHQLRLIDWIIKNDGLARPLTLAKAKTNWEAIDQTITITANIANGIKWGLGLVIGMDQGLEVLNRPGTWSRPRKP